MPTLIEESPCKTGINHRCMKLILLSSADVFIKLNVKSKPPYLETLWFLFFNVKILKLTQAKRLPNPVLRPSGAKVGGNQEQIKSMIPTLIDEPLRKTGIKQRCTKIIFLGELWHVSLALAPRKPVNIILKSSFVELSHQGQILKLIQNTSYHILATNISPGPPSAPG